MRSTPLEPIADPRPAPIVVVGAGPVGVRFVQLLLERDPHCHVVLYGKEPWDPYNRVQLSTFLTGETGWADLTQGLSLPDSPRLTRLLQCEVIDIDRQGARVQDTRGVWQAYSRLVLATGSKARVPDLPGIGQAGVFVFRDLADTQALFARRTRSVRTVVLGGGLLGLEAARAMQRFHTEVTVIEHGDRLMGRQLDAGGAEALRTRIEGLGIQVRTSAAVKAIKGHGRVTGIELRSGDLIACDTVVVSVGIVPDTGLALDCGLALGRGIRVDDGMRSSDPAILAIGECAEHRGQVYGLVAPGLEQAGVAVNTVLGGDAHYQGSLASTRLKVAGLSVFSLGTVDPGQATEPVRLLAHADAAQGAHRTIALSRGRLVGAVAVGPCAEANRLQEAVLAQRRVWPWQALRWQRQGRLWPADTNPAVADWPADTIVCHCNQVSKGRLDQAFAEGCQTVQALGACTRAGTVCGSCKPLLGELLTQAGGSASAPEPTRAWHAVAASAALSALLTLVVLLMPGWAYLETVQGDVAWQRLWTDSLWKQWTGYGVLALSALALTLTLRKRLWPQGQGHFDLWRLAHVLLGLLALAALAVHTGARFGGRLDWTLMACFTGLALVGAVGAGVIALGHRHRPALVQRWRRTSVWTHILLFWPVPVLLAFHILKSYWF